MSLITSRAEKSNDGNIVIPATAFIPCPQADYRNTRVAKCPACPFFQGIVDCDPKASAERLFVDRFRILCGKPIARRTVHVEID